MQDPIPSTSPTSKRGQPAAAPDAPLPAPTYNLDKTLKAMAKAEEPKPRNRGMSGFSYGATSTGYNVIATGGN